MEQIIHDHIPKILESEGKIVGTRRAKSNEEFFKLLHQKSRKDLDRIFSEKDIKYKTYALAEMMVNMNAIIDAIEDHGKIKFWEEYDKRINKIGALDKRLVLIGNNNSNVDLIKFVLDYGEKNNYPSIVIKKDTDGNPYKQIGSGKEAWMSAIAWANLNSPYNKNFDDFVEAVKNEEAG